MTCAPDRKWLPVDWQDEMTPAPSASPSDFLRFDAEGAFLAPLDWSPEGEPDGSGPIRLTDGTNVKFSWVENHGHRTLTVLEDGTWSLDAPFPEGTEQFWLPGEPDTISLSIDDLVRGDDGFWVEPLDAGDTIVGGYTWGPASRWRYDAATKSMIQEGTVQ
jgi:hypothetical protein